MASSSETGLQLFARLIPRPSLIGLDPVLFPEGPNPKEVIEINGELCCGKTLLFNQFIVRCILPKELKNIAIGGLKASVVLLNTDHHFQIYKLISLMEYHLKDVCDSFSVSDIEEVVKESLARLVIYNITDSVQLQVTFHALQTVVSHQPEIALILLDSVSAFYWQDSMSSGIKKMDSYVKNIVKTLQRILGDFKGVIMYTRPSYFQSKFSKLEPCTSETGLGSVNHRVILKQIAQDKNVFCASVESLAGRFTRMFTIGPGGIQWME